MRRPHPDIGVISRYLRVAIRIPCRIARPRLRIAAPLRGIAACGESSGTEDNDASPPTRSAISVLYAASLTRSQPTNVPHLTARVAHRTIRSATRSRVMPRYRRLDTTTSLSSARPMCVLPVRVRIAMRSPLSSEPGQGPDDADERRDWRRGSGQHRRVARRPSALDPFRWKLRS